MPQNKSTANDFQNFYQKRNSYFKILDFRMIKNCICPLTQKYIEKWVNEPLPVADLRGARPSHPAPPPPSPPGFQILSIPCSFEGI